MTATTARTDIHRPSAPEFDPENYVVLGVFDLHPEEGDLRYRAEVVRDAVAQGWTFTGAPHPAGQCDHCGAHLRYEALLVHRPTRTLVEIGETCLDNRFFSTADGFKRLRKAAAAKSAATREANRLHDTAAEVADWLATADERLSELTYRGNGGTVDGNSFLSDVAYKLFKYGNISDRQIGAVVGAVTREADRRGRQDRQATEDAARQASATDAPTGKTVITGIVGPTWTKEGDYGLTYKARVTADEGYVVITTIPAALLREIGGSHEALRGKRVQFTATLTPTDDDPTTAWAHRPSRAGLIMVTPVDLDG